MESERRGSPRFPFIASAELTKLTSGARLNASTSDIGSNGCYLDTINPLPPGTIINIQITYQGRLAHLSRRAKGGVFSEPDFSAPSHVPLQCFHPQVQLNGPGHRHESKAGQQRTDQNAFLRVVSRIAHRLLQNVCPRQQEYDRQAHDEILSCFQVARFLISARSS